MSGESYRRYGPVGPRAWAYAQDPGSSTKKFLLVVLSDYADEYWSCYPSQETLALDICADPRTVRRLLLELERDGFIRRVPRLRDDRRGRTSDRIYLDAGPTEAEIEADRATDEPYPDNLSGLDELGPSEGSPVDDQPAKLTGGPRTDCPGNLSERTTTSSRSSTYARAARPDDDDRSRTGSQGNVPSPVSVEAMAQRNGARVNAALNVLVQRHLDDRVTTLGPVRNVDAWRTTDRRKVEQDHGRRLRQLASEHPELTAEGLAEQIEPLFTPKEPLSASPLDGQQRADRARQVAGMEHIRAIVEEPPPPEAVSRAGFEQARAALRRNL